MSSSPIILQTVADLGGITQLKAGLQSIGASADQANESFNRVATASNELSQEVNYVNENNMRARASFDEDAAASTQFGYSVREARGSARLLSDELGLHLNRELANTLARSETLGPILEGAFSVFAIVGFIELLDQASKKFDAMIENAAGWGKAQQEAYQRALALNSEMISRNLELRTSERDLNQVGLEGAAKRAVQVKDLTAEQKDYADQTAGALNRQREFNAEIQHWQNLQQIPFVMNQDLISQKIQDATASLKRAEDETDRFTQKQKDLGEQMRQVKTEGTADTAKNTRADLSGAADAYKTYIDAIEAGDQAYYKARYQLGEISLAQEVAQLRESEQRKFDVETETYNKLRALKLQEGKDTGKNVTPEIEKMDAEQYARHTAFSSKMIELDATTQLQLRKQAEDTAFAQIADDLKVAQSKTHLAEVQERFAFSHAESPAELEAAAIPLIRTATEQYEQQITALRERAKVLTDQEVPEQSRPSAALGTDDFSRQLQAVKGTRQEVINELAAMNAEEIDLRHQQATAVVQIKNEETEKLQSLGKRELDDTISDLDRQLSETKTRYQGELIGFETLQASKSISERRFADEAKSLAQQELADKLTILERERTAVEAAANQGVISEREAERQIKAIDEKELQDKQQEKNREAQIVKQAATKEAQEMKQVLNTISTSMNTALNEWMLGHKKFAAAAEQAWDSIATKAIDSVVKIGENFLVGLLLQQSAQEKQVLMDAKAAAANAWASAPNPIVGAVEAAATFAAVVGAYMPTFEFGGIVPGASGSAVPIIAHADEMVLPAHISTFVQDAAARAAGAPGRDTAGSSSSGLGGVSHTTNHFNIEVNQSSGKPMSPDEITKAVRRAYRVGALP